MKILVTGGAGFIGSHIADRYLELGHEVLIVDNLSTGFKTNVPSRAKFFETDIRDYTSIEWILSKEKVDVINHQAAQADVRLSVEDPLEDCSVNIDGLVHLYDSARKNGLKKFIFASSGGVVYGEPAQIPVPVDAPYNPQSPYGVSKVASEYYLKCFHHLHALPTSVLRYANVYGPRQNGGEAGVISIFFKKMIAGEEVVIFGDGEQLRDFVYVQDVVDANVLTLEARGYQTVNIGTADAVSVNTVFREISRLTGYRRPPKHDAARPGEILKSALDISKTAASFGWKPAHSLKEGLAKTHEWWRASADR